MKSAGMARRLRECEGTYAAASSSTEYPRLRASSINDNGCSTPEKFDCAGSANRLGVRRGAVVSAATGSSRRRSAVSGTVTTAAPARRANSRTPLTELWLSALSASVLPGANGYDSATSLIAALAFAVKHTAYSPGSASKNSSVRARARSIVSVLCREGPCSECGLPKIADRNSSSCAAICDADGSAAPV